MFISVKIKQEPKDVAADFEALLCATSLMMELASLGFGELEQTQTGDFGKKNFEVELTVRKDLKEE